VSVTIVLSDSLKHPYSMSCTPPPHVTEQAPRFVLTQTGIVRSHGVFAKQTKDWETSYAHNVGLASTCMPCLLYEKHLYVRGNTVRHVSGCLVQLGGFCSTYTGDGHALFTPSAHGIDVAGRTIPLSTHVCKSKEVSIPKIDSDVHVIVRVFTPPPHTTSHAEYSLTLMAKTASNSHMPVMVVCS
jgi:hypothetical protein